MRTVSGKTQTRRQFLQAAAAVGAMAAASGKLRAGSPAPAVRWPKLKGSPVLDSLAVNISATDIDQLAATLQYKISRGKVYLT